MINRLEKTSEKNLGEGAALPLPSPLPPVRPRVYTQLVKSILNR